VPKLSYNKLKSILEEELYNQKREYEKLNDILHATATMRKLAVDLINQIAILGMSEYAGTHKFSEIVSQMVREFLNKHYPYVKEVNQEKGEK
jgi:hypothetical protein